MNLPYLTANLPGIGGQLKAFPEDFVVEEVPLYPASGEGQHIYAIIEKRGISTYAAVKEMARALKIAPVSIGYAGLKDAHAITRQTVSISNVKEEAVRALNLPKIQVLHITRHRNKLKVGHLAGNRFVIRVRQVTEEALPAAQAVLDVLAAKGAPNYFGEQRFGLRRNTHRLGELLVRNNLAEFVPEYLGRPQEGEAEYIQAVRRLVDENRWAEALAQWPPNLSDEGRVLAALVKAEGRLDVVHRALDKKLRGLFVSAYQSELFNGLLVERLATFDQLEPGDVAYIHGKGASFVVEEAAVEQPRADRFEISPSGPLFGPKMLLAQGEPGRREQAVLAEQGLTPDDFSIEGFKVRGARRPYRLQIKNPQTGWDDGLVVSFELEPGAYATTVMAEIMKTG
jgi:tRNA pseudouridine13 synthase